MYLNFIVTKRKDYCSKENKEYYKDHKIRQAGTDP